MSTEPTGRCHRVFLASAGTGKTYRLSGRFIDLLLAGHPPRSILATTFTRKAAGEILDRVLERLMDAVGDGDERRELAEMRDFGATFTSAEALTCLTGLLRGLDRFEVRTLDSYFVQVARLFALDLDLAPGWSLANTSESKEMTSDALGHLLNGLDSQEAEARFAELLREVTKDGGAGRSVHDSLTRLVEGGREVFLDSTDGAWDCVHPPKGLSPEELKALAARLDAMVVPNTKAGTPVKHWKDAKENLQKALAARDWAAIPEVGLVQKIDEGAEKFSRHEITSELKALVRDLLQQVAHELMGLLVERNGRALQILQGFEGYLHVTKRERGLYDFSDIPRALAGKEMGQPNPLAARDLQLAYRLDGKLGHLLLDEFQDTAPVQWGVLEEMAENIAADGSWEQSFFCVGDVKQSIYGWRAAEPRLLGQLGEHLHLEPESLELNYRSSQVILDTVNQVFESLDTLVMFQDKDGAAYGEAAERFGADFKEHTAHGELAGTAELRQTRPVNSWEKSESVCMDLAVERIIALASDAPSASIGVLVRSNKPIPALIARLQSRGLPVSGEGGNPLTDSAAVLHFLALLHLADHPTDTLAAFSVSHSPLPEALGISDVQIDGEALSRIVRKRLTGRGLGRLCADLEAAVCAHGQYSDWDRRRYKQLTEIAFAHSDEADLRADLFVDRVRQQSVELPAAARIKVMTVHASKGLEFDAVVLPDLDGNLIRSQWTFLHDRPDPRGAIEQASLNPGRRIATLEPGLKRLYHEQKVRHVREALCVLYVAMTRAKHRLEMIVARPKSSGETKSSAGILRSVLATHELVEGSEEEACVLWRHPESVTQWFPGTRGTQGRGEQGAGPDSSSEGGDTPALGLKPSTGPRRLPTRSPSSQEGGECCKGRDVLAGGTGSGARFGSLVHHMLEHANWPGEGLLGADEVLAATQALEPSEELRQVAFEYLRASLAKPAMAAALSRPVEEGCTFTVWSERDFAVILDRPSGPVSCSGTFDRVVLCSRGNQVVSATIQDYKTDRVNEETIASRIEHYRPQLKAYRSALAVMVGIAEDAIDCELLFLGPGRVCKL